MPEGVSHLCEQRRQSCMSAELRRAMVRKVQSVVGHVQAHSGALTTGGRVEMGPLVCPLANMLCVVPHIMDMLSPDSWSLSTHHYHQLQQRAATAGTQQDQHSVCELRQRHSTYGHD